VTPLAELWKRFGRSCHFGVPLSDLLRPWPRGRDITESRELLYDLAQQYLHEAEQAAANGRAISAAEHYQLATACAHYSQLGSNDAELKRRAHHLARRAYATSTPLLAPPARRVEVPFEGGRLPGYLRVAGPDRPCVILINGLDSIKEVELHTFATGFLARGNTVFVFDGPGQGECAGELPMTTEFETAVHAVRRWLMDREAVRGPFGVFGVSFGGYLACRAAATDPELAACVSLGGIYDGRALSHLPPLGATNLRRAFGLGPDGDLDALCARLTLDPLGGRCACPLLIVHGTEDHLVDAEQWQLLTSWAPAATDVLVFEGAEHVCTDRFSFCLPRLWDWMTERLSVVAQGLEPRCAAG
jgi:2,6-dihydroxypseudooxynicotine hydrolase